MDICHNYFRGGGYPIDFKIFKNSLKNNKRKAYITGAKSSHINFKIRYYTKSIIGLILSKNYRFEKNYFNVDFRVFSPLLGYSDWTLSAFKMAACKELSFCRFVWKFYFVILFSGRILSANGEFERTENEIYFLHILV